MYGRVQVQKILDLRALGVYLTTCIIIILDMKGEGDGWTPFKSTNGFV